MNTRIVKIRVVPRSSKSEIVGQMADGVLKIKIKSPPVDGMANDELTELLSEEFGVAKSMVRIVKGAKTKNKVAEIES